MAVTYIPAGTNFGAEHMTQLFGELERKTAALFDNKTPLIVASSGRDQDSNDSLNWMLGNLYFFVNGIMPIARQWLPQNYDHDIFRQGVATMSEVSRDEEKKIITMTLPPDSTYPVQLGRYMGATFMELSLQAHRSGDYWLRDYGTQVPQKFYKFAVAEMIYEGRGYETVLIPQTWNKYNFFRFHNCNPYSMTVTFEGSNDGTGHAVRMTINRYACKTIRRDSVASGYSQVWSYFWPFISGDPRSFSFPNTDTPPGVDVPNVGPIRQTAWQSCAANNVVNPCILYDWIAYYSRPTRNAGLVFYRDWQAFYDIRPSNSEVFGDASNPQTIIGDLLHHKGGVRTLTRNTDNPQYIAQDVPFTGYANISTDFTPAGITVTDLGNVLRLEHVGGDQENVIVGTKTNLMAGATPDPEVNPTGYLLNTAKPGDLGDPYFPLRNQNRVNPIESSTVSIAYQYGDFTLPSGTWDMFSNDDLQGFFSSATVNYQEIGQAQSTENLNPLRIYKDRVVDVLTLNHFGNNDRASTNQDSPYGTFQNRVLTMTVTGLKLSYKQVFLLRGSNFNNPNPLIPPIGLNGTTVFCITPDVGELSGTSTVTFKYRPISFEGYGWPADDSRRPAFCDPRRDRAYSEYAYTVTEGIQSWSNPNIENEPFGKSGVDVDFSPIDPNYHQWPVRTLIPLTMSFPNWPKLWPIWSNPDNLYDVITANNLHQDSIVMPRFFVMEENYNDMAATVNSITGCFPVTIFNLPIEVQTSDGGDGVAFFEYNDLGFSTSTIRPVEQFAKIQEGSGMEILCFKLGIPIKTADDFPQSYKDYLIDPGQSWNLTVSEDHQIVSVTTNSTLPFTNSYYPSATGTWEFQTVRYKVVPGSKFELNSIPIGGAKHNLYSDQEGIVFSPIPANDYRWVSIEDVKTAASSLGFKLILRELTAPIKFSKFSSTPSMLWSSVPSPALEFEYPYVHLVPIDFSPIPPEYLEFVIASTGVGTIANMQAASSSSRDVQIEGLPGSIWAFTPDESPDFKKSIQFPILGDRTAGDINTTEIDGLNPGGSVNLNPSPGTPAYRQIVQLSLDESVRSEDPSTSQMQIRYRKKMMYRREVSNGSGLVSDNSAILVPIPFLTHPSTDYSAQSFENAVKIRAGASIPLTVIDSVSTERIDLNDEGTTFISAIKDSANELILNLNDRVVLE